MASAERARYHFGPRQQKGLLAGWKVSQVMVVVSAAGVGVLLLHRPGRAAGAVAAATLLTCAILAVTLPWRGHTLVEWVPFVAAWGGRRLSGRVVVSRPARQGHAGRSRHSLRAEGVAALRGCLLLSPSPRPGQPHLGVVKDPRSNCYSAALELSSQALALADPEDREARVSSWTSVLAALARDGQGPHRLQWLARTVPASLVSLELDARGQDQVPEDARDSYSRLLSQETPNTWRHQILLVVGVSGRRSAKAIASLGGGDEGACALLGRYISDLRGELRQAGLGLAGPLSPAALSRCLRIAWAEDGWCRLDQPPLRGAANEVVWTWPWPQASEVRWASCLVEGTWHATYWIAEWPRVEVQPDFLAPLLLGKRSRRSVTLVMEPVPAAKATRQTEHARTAGLADNELRRRGGFAVTARLHRQTELVAQREAELADGHAQFRFSGYVGVTADSPENLEAACSQVESAGAQAHLELLRCYGEADAAFTCTLPMARGLS